MLEERCQQFHEVAVKLTNNDQSVTTNSKNTIKEINKLVKFLHKNQNQDRFTEKARSRLVDTIALYRAYVPHSITLLEDALKMPYTVFSTKQKKTLLKWLEEIKGKEDGGGVKVGQSSTQNSQSLVTLNVMDWDKDELKKNEASTNPLSSLSFLDPMTGEVYEKSGDTTQLVAFVDETVRKELITTILEEEQKGNASILLDVEARIFTDQDTGSTTIQIHQVIRISA